MKRRDVLMALLGAPAALAACQRHDTKVPPLPDGELVFRSEELGHRLRDRLSIEPARDRWEDIPVVIVGGGVAGLAAAWRFMRAGFDRFILLELDPVAGGTARSGSSSLGSIPWGAHYITAPLADDRAMVHLLGEMGIVDGKDERGQPVIREEHLCREPEERLFYLGRWYDELYLHAGSSAEDRAQRHAFEAEIGRLAALRDSRGRRAFALPSSQCSDDAALTELDRISMSTWMDARGFTSPRLRWYVDYACRDDYGLRMEHTSAWAGLLYFAARLNSPEAAYQPVVTWPEGNGRLIGYLANAAGHRVRLGWAVAEIRHSTPDAGDLGMEVIALTEGGRAAAGIRTRHILFAAPQFVAPYVIRAWRDQPPAHAGRFDYGAWLVANLTLRERPGGLGAPLSWDNVLYDSPSLGYVVSSHQRGLDHGPVVITYYYPLLDPDGRAGRRMLYEAGWAEWAEVVLSDLERAHRNIRSLVDRIDIMRWGHGMIRPQPGFVWGGARHAAMQPYRGIHFAHSDLSGVALFEEALDHGVRAAEEILAARGMAVVSLR